MAARKRLTEDHSQVKALTPKDPDTKYMGDEPLFLIQPDNEYRKVALAKSLTWYNRFYGKKDAKELLCQFLELSNRDKEAKLLRKANENDFVNSYSWLARMKLRGLELNEQENLVVENQISRLINLVKTPEVKHSNTSLQKPTVEVKVNKPNIQDILREKTRDAAGELEGMFDEYIKEGKTLTKVMDVLSKNNVMPQHISFINEIWKRKQTEFTAIVDGKDKDIAEAYSYLGKVKLKNTIKFIDQVLSDLNSYVSIKKVNKTPRKRKVVPVEKLVAKLQYLKAFKDAANKLDLVSVHPTKLHGSSEAWVYDTSKRKLHHYIADEYSKTFTVKGNTILGFDANKSEVKTLRKPGEQIKEIMGSKPAARKYFENIKAVASKPNGRFNKNLIILKAF